jgi:hypothetical protein
MANYLLVTEKTKANVIDDIIKAGEHPECDKLERYRRQGKINKKGVLLVEHKHILKNERSYINGRLTLMSFTNELRKKISVKCYDLDIVKCLPSCARYYAKKYSIDTPQLDDYLKNTEDWFEAGLTKKDINIILNKVDAKKFLESKNNQKLNGLHTEVQLLIEKLKNLNEFKSQIKYAKQKTEEINPNNFLFYILAPLELQVIRKVYDFCETNGIHFNCYTYDGALIQIPDELKSNDILKEINKLVEDIVTFKYKPFNENEKKSEGEKISNDTGIVDTGPVDCRISDKIVEYFKGRIYRVGDKLMVYDELEGIWFENPKDHLRIFKRENYLFEIEEKCNFLAIYKNIYQLIEVSAPVDNNFYNDKDTGYLLFNNGVLDMYYKKILPFNSDYRFTKKINRSFDPYRDYDTERLLDTLFKSMITDEEKMEYLLQLLARGVAGQYLDRQFLVLLGNSACGKSLIVKLFKYTFGSFITTFVADNLIKKTGNNRHDPERENAVLTKIFDTRLAFASEFSLPQDTTGRDFKIDGNKVKSWVSGGDSVDARKVGLASFELVNKSTICMVCNDILEVDNPDQSYIDRANYIQADRSSQKGLLEPNVKFFPAINPDEIDEYIKNTDTLDSLVSLMCDYYADSIDLRMERPESVKHTSLEYIGEQNKPDNWVEKNFEIVPIHPDWITGDVVNWDLVGDNWIAFDDLYQAYKRDGQQGSQTKFGRVLGDFSISKQKKVNKKNVMVRIGIKRLSNEIE